MELPPAGWYPDPYGTPDLLRWWDGSAWTQHTHASVTSDGGDAASGSSGASGAGQAAARQASEQPATAAGADQLAKAGPPTGPPTSPQPALPVTAVQAAVQPTAYQPAVTAVQAPVQPTAQQPPVSAAPASGPAGAGGGNAGGTQVLFTGGDAWTTPGVPGVPGAPGGPGADYGYGYGYGYQHARQERRRRMIMLGGLAAGTVAALAVIAVVVMAMGGSGAAPTAQQPPATPTAAAATASPSVTPSPSASTSPSAALLSDGQSGLSYPQLAGWQPTCPASLNNGAFTWTAGESAIAGQVNGGQTTWYGEACSGPLPQQYGYGGVSTLESTATNVASTFANAYYNTLAHTVTTQVSQPVQVSGHAGWEVKFLVSYTDTAGQGVTFPDEQAAVVLADTGTGLAPSVFFASIPSTLGETNVDGLVSALQLTPPPSPGGSPGDGGSPTDGGGGSPGDGGGNGGGGGNNP